VSDYHHGDPGIGWGEANAANEDGQAVIDAETAAAENDAAAGLSPHQRAREDVRQMWNAAFGHDPF
jgi:hypothetical protein